MEKPFLLDETDDFAVVYKPPRLHCAPLKPASDDTLLDWYAAVFPPVLELSGRKEGEGGLLHRLDFETRGLVLFAKNQQTLDYLLQQQDEGKFIKKYSAVCRGVDALPPDFPPPPFDITKDASLETPFTIGSFFRPYGPGRKQVRPLVNCSNGKIKYNYYRTEIKSFFRKETYYNVSAELNRGFRHQIRCHLAWIGCPILNDPVYGENVSGDFLALKAMGLSFFGPCGSGFREYRLPENS